MKKARQLTCYVSRRKKKLCKKVKIRAERRFLKALIRKMKVEDILRRINKKMFFKGYA